MVAFAGDLVAREEVTRGDMGACGQLMQRRCEQILCIFLFYYGPRVTVYKLPVDYPLGEITFLVLRALWRLNWEVRNAEEARRGRQEWSSLDTCGRKGQRVSRAAWEPVVRDGAEVPDAGESQSEPSERRMLQTQRGVPGGGDGRVAREPWGQGGDGASPDSLWLPCEAEGAVPGTDEGAASGGSRRRGGRRRVVRDAFRSAFYQRKRGLSPRGL